MCGKINAGVRKADEGRGIEFGKGGEIGFTVEEEVKKSDQRVCKVYNKVEE